MLPKRPVESVSNMVRFHTLRSPKSSLIYNHWHDFTSALSPDSYCACTTAIRSEDLFERIYMRHFLFCICITSCVVFLSFICLENWCFLFLLTRRQTTPPLRSLRRKLKCLAVTLLSPLANWYIGGPRWTTQAFLVAECYKSRGWNLQNRDDHGFWPPYSHSLPNINDGDRSCDRHSMEFTHWGS